VDGQLSEACYQGKAPFTGFVVAGQPAVRPQPTKAWLFWNLERLVFAFEVTDAQIVGTPPSGRERDVDTQDRVEVFLWSGRTNDTYHCIEIGARGAVHDYAARFYRQFDDGWSPAGLKTAAVSTPSGYLVEGEIPGAALEAMGLRLRDGLRLRLGLFRADFRPGRSEDPTWICWVDARGPQPDFHVAGSFGTAVLAGPSRKASP
jgi:hypothetical protein